LLIAIQYKQIDIVRFILEKMKVDRRLQLSVVVGEEEKQCNALSEAELTYSLLAACSNHDLLMLRYLWETYGSLFWDLSNFQCLMKQLIS